MSLGPVVRARERCRLLARMEHTVDVSAGYTSAQMAHIYVGAVQYSPGLALSHVNHADCNVRTLPECYRVALQWLPFNFQFAVALALTTGPRVRDSLPLRSALYCSASLCRRLISIVGVRPKIAASTKLRGVCVRLKTCSRDNDV